MISGCQLSNKYERMSLTDEDAESDAHVRYLAVYLRYYLNSAAAKSMWFKIDVYPFLKHRTSYTQAI